MGPILAVPVVVATASAVGLTAVGTTVVVNVVKTTNARSDALSETKKEFSWDIDEDDRERDCSVRCYKRRIIGLNNHWALTFDWDGYKATYEADEVGGYLIPRWKIGGPEFSYKWEESESFPVKCSPRSVNAKALAIPYNGATYILTKVNGHLWVECLARAFGIITYKLSADDEMFIPAPVASALDYFLKGK